MNKTWHNKGYKQQLQFVTQRKSKKEQTIKTKSTFRESYCSYPNRCALLKLTDCLTIYRIRYYDK